MWGENKLSVIVATNVIDKRSMFSLFGRLMMLASKTLFSRLFSESCIWFTILSGSCDVHETELLLLFLPEQHDFMILRHFRLNIEMFTPLVGWHSGRHCTRCGRWGRESSPGHSPGKWWNVLNRQARTIISTYRLCQSGAGDWPGRVLLPEAGSW